MVGLVNTKDFYVDTHFMCGLKTTENIFDLPDEIFECGDLFCFEEALKKYVKPHGVKLHLWPWNWHDSSLTDEVYIYDIETNSIIYYTNDVKEFFDAKLIRMEQCLHGCERVGYTFQFPQMLNLQTKRK